MNSEFCRFNGERPPSIIIKDNDEINRLKAQWLLDGNSIKTFGKTEIKEIVMSGGKKLGTPQDAINKRIEKAGKMKK